MSKVVHFEIPTDDLERAKTFYGSVFGWELQTVPMNEGEYTSVITTDVDEQTQQPTEPGAINGGMFVRGERRNGTGDHHRRRWHRRRAQAGRGGGRHNRHATDRDPWYGRIRLLQGPRGERARSVGDYAIGTQDSVLAALPAR